MMQKFYCLKNKIKTKKIIQKKLHFRKVSITFEMFEFRDTSKTTNITEKKENVPFPIFVGNKIISYKFIL